MAAGPESPRDPTPAPGAVTSAGAEHADSVGTENSGGQTSEAPRPCGELDCLAFPSAAAAFSHVLAQRPRVLAIGDAHALAGSKVPSVTHRFTHELLPLLEGRASALVVELLLPDPRCQKEAKVVRKEQKVVTKQQSSENQNEFVTLGHASRRIGIEPFPLRPDCERLARIASAGPDTVIEMLSAIKELTELSVVRLLARDQKAGRDLMVVPYGGAMHNDVSPAEGRASWSFGPSLSKHVDGHYIEFDLIVPEFIKDTEAWRSLPWYGAYDRARHGESAVLFRTGPQSYVLVFPFTSAAATGADTGEADAGR